MALLGTNLVEQFDRELGPCEVELQADELQCHRQTSSDGSDQSIAERVNRALFARRQRRAAAGR